jgi:hypothetical protein
MTLKCSRRYQACAVFGGKKTRRDGLPPDTGAHVAAARGKDTSGRAGSDRNDYGKLALDCAEDRQAHV